jgi:hypothetical protein
MVCHITQTWRGKALVSRVTVVDQIVATTTETGLTLQCEVDKKSDASGIKVTDAEMATPNIEGDPWHPEWNYTIKPRPPGRSGDSWVSPPPSLVTAYAATSRICRPALGCEREPSNANGSRPSW